MKPLYSCLIFIAMFAFFEKKALANQPLYCYQTVSLYSHLIEINGEWVKYSSLLDRHPDLTNFNSDQERIQKHLALVEFYLRNKKCDDLTSQQLTNRIRMLDILQHYWQEGIFPKNTRHNRRLPYFIDDFGTYCAVGYLMAKSGAEAATAAIQAFDNNGYLKELAIKYPVVGAWALENGFTIDELAWIQPTYGPLPQNWNMVGNGGGCNGRINTMKATNNKLYIGGSFTMMDGIPCNNIIAWNGTDWETLGDGVNGEVYDIEIVGLGKALVVGDFSLFSDSTQENIAYFDSTWHGLQTGDMMGKVLVAYSSGTNCYLGGDFKQINGDTTFKSLATLHFSLSQGFSWMQNPAFSTDGTVRVIYPSSYWWIGGSFQKTAPGSTDPEINQFPSTNLALWSSSDNNWHSSFINECSNIYIILKSDQLVYAGGDLNQENGLCVLDGGIWTNIGYSYEPLWDGIIHGIVGEDVKYIYGGFYYNPPANGYWGSGIMQLGGNGIALTNGTVRAGEYFQNQYYFGGDFTEINGQPFNGLVSSPLNGYTTTEEINDVSMIRVYDNGSDIIIQENQLTERTMLGFYDLNGRHLHSIELTPGFVEMRCSIPASGNMIFYSTWDNHHKIAGKLVRF